MFTLQTRISSSSKNRTSRSTPHGEGKKQRRFTHSFGGMYSARIGCVVQKTNIELHGCVVKTGNLVRTWTHRKHSTTFQPLVFSITPYHLLHCEQSETLRPTTLHLSNINSGIQTLTQIHDYISLTYLQVSCEHVDLDFTACNTTSKVSKRCSSLGITSRSFGLEVVPDVGCLVKSLS